MTELAGVFFDGRTSRAHEARARVEAGVLVVVAGEDVRRFDLAAVRIEPPMGRVRRAFTMRGGERFETADLAGVADLERALRRNRGSSFVHRLESRWPLVLVSAVVLVIGGFLIWRFGLPLGADLAARLTPRGALSAIDAQAVRLIDGELFSPTKLPRATRDRLTRDFGRVVRDIGGAGYRYKLEFRDGGSLGANALALPGGTVYVTDQLVDLAKSDREIEGVLAHEVGHVVERHGLQGAYQSVGLALLLGAVLGDVGTATTIAASIPSVIIQSGYSREKEREADTLAGRYLVKRYGSAEPLARLLTRLTEDRGGEDESLSFLDSHPGLRDRIENLRRAGQEPQRSR